MKYIIFFFSDVFSLFILFRAKTKEDQENQFWKGADFGYVLERQKELTYFCKPKEKVNTEKYVLYTICKAIKCL